MFIRTAILIFEIEKVWKMYKKKGSQRHNEQEKKRYFDDNKINYCIF